VSRIAASKETSKKTAKKARKVLEVACTATTGCRPSKMPPAKEAASATAGSFM
jgi:hypothetical protein